MSPKEKNQSFQSIFVCLLLGGPPLVTGELDAAFFGVQLIGGKVAIGCGSLWVLQVTLPAGSSTTFPLKSVPEHKNWHFLIFLNDDINYLLFLFSLSETFSNSLLFLFPPSGCFPGAFNPLFSLPS